MEKNSPVVLVNEDALGRPRRRGLLATAGDLALASIGVIDVMLDGPQALYQRSVERGGEAVKRLQDRVPRGRRLRRRAGRLAGKGERSSQTSEQVEAGMARLNAATAADIDALALQVTELEGKINQLGP
jgi:hypothetical protein